MVVEIEMIEDEMQSQVPVQPLGLQSCMTKLSSPYKSDRMDAIQQLILLASNRDHPLFLDKTHLVLCHTIETILPSLELFREKQKYLTQLAIIVSSGKTSDLFRKIAIHFFLGCMFVNFTALWKPLQQMLVQCLKSETNSHVGLNAIVVDKVQTIFARWTDQTVDHEGHNASKAPTTPAVSLVNEKPDYVSYFVNVVQAMEFAPECFEPLNKSLVTMMLSIVDSALNHSDNFEEDDESKDDLTEDGGGDEGQDGVCDDDGDEEDPGLDLQDKWRVVNSFLKLFSRFKSPKSYFMAAEVESAFQVLLKNPRPSVQEYAFRCITTYNNVHLKPYKDRMLTFFKEESFKYALSDFVINATNEDDRVLKDKDRDHVMPLLLKILFGRMKSKTSLKKVKSASQTKQSLVMRYITGCSDKELAFFLTLNFSCLEPLINMPYNELVSVDASAWDKYPIRLFESFFHTLTALIDSLGGLVSIPVAEQFLKLLLVISSYTSTDKNKAPVTRVKILRSSCIKNLSDFFDNFENYPFQQEEINCIFQVLNPSLYTFSSDFVGNISSVMILLRTWSRNSRLFPLLDYSVNGNEKPLAIMMSVLETGRAVSVVIETILGIIHNLLVLEKYSPSDDEMETDSSIPCFELPSTKSDGKVILQPFLSVIIAFYTRRLASLASKRKKRGGGEKLQSRDLKVLQSLSLVVEDENDCLCLTQLLIEVFSRHYLPHDESTLEYSETILKLTCRMGRQGQKLIGSLAPLFLTVQESSVRTDFATAVETIVKHGVLRQQTKNEEEKNESEMTVEKPENENVVLMLSEAVRLLHECSQKRIDEPDFEARFLGFKKITQALKLVREKDEQDQQQDKGEAYKEEEAKMTLDLLKITAYSCCFFLTQSSLDQSLKSSSCTALEMKAQELSRLRDPSFFNEICIGIVLRKGIRSGFRSEHEKIRFEFIGVLHALMTHAKDRNQELSQMARLMHHDIEVDFWMNAKHLQTHRRAKAFARLVSKTKLLQSLSQEVLWNYILPLAHECLFSEESPGAPEHLTNASVDLIGTLCRFIDYGLYESLLQRYLSFLFKQTGHLSVVVKLISKILSNFNYDLSNASLTVLTEGHETPRTPSTKMARSQEEEAGADVDKSEHESTKDALNNNEDDEVEEEEGDDLMYPEKKIQEKEEMDSKVMMQETGEQEGEPDQTEMKKLSGRQKLSPEKATFILKCIVKKLMPELKQAVFEVSFSDYDHNSGMKNTKDESDQVQRIPIAIAVVKLLLLIPDRFRLLQDNLTGILLRLCHFLKSRTHSIREVARKSLKMIAQDLGPAYLPDVLKELKSSLTKGFQRHILSFTIHYLFIGLRAKIETGSLDKMFPLLLDVVFDDLMGEVGQEKEVDQLQGKAKEMKRSKSFDILHIMASVAGESTIIPLFARLKHQLSICRNFKECKKVSHCLNVVVQGLSTNKSLSETTLCTLIYGISKEQIEELGSKRDASAVDKKKASQLRKDSLLIEDPLKMNKKKAGRKSHVSSVNHMFVLTEKAVVLLHLLLKNQRLKNCEPEHLSLLDPLVVILMDTLSSKHVKLVCAGMRCLLDLLKDFPSLPTLIASCNVIKNRLFALLAENSRYSSGRDGEHKTLIALSFQVISFLVASVSRVDVSDDQVLILLTHVDEDLTLGGNKPSSFILLSALIERKVSNSTLTDIMDRVFQLAIQCEGDIIRNRCVKVSCQFLKQQEKMGKNMRQHLLFFIRQLEYEFDYGRLACIRILTSMIKSLPANILEPHLTILLVPLGCRLMNEDSVLCKESIYSALKHLLLSVSQAKRDKMFQQLIWTWFTDEEGDSRDKNILAMHVMSILIEVEADYFLEKRAPVILPLLVNSLRDSTSSQEKSDEEEDKYDDLFFQRLTFFKKMLVLGGKPLVRDIERSQEDEDKKKKKKRKKSTLDILRQEVNKVWHVLQDFYLVFPYSWVRLITAQLFGHLFSLYDAQELAQVSLSEVAASSSTADDEYLCEKLDLILPILTKKFSFLFRSIVDLQDPLAEQLVENLGFIAKVVIWRNRVFREQEPREEEEEGQERGEGGGLKKKRKLDSCDDDYKQTSRKKRRKIERKLVRREEQVGQEEENGKEMLTLDRFLRPVLRLMRLEVGLNQGNVCIRTHITKLVGLLILELSQDELISVLDQLLCPLAREAARDPLTSHSTEDGSRGSSQEEREKLVMLSKQILDAIKSLVGDEVFNHSYAQTQLDIKKRRLQRKQEKILDAVSNPEQTYHRKKMIREKKKVLLKRKKVLGLTIRRKKRKQQVPL